MVTSSLSSNELKKQSSGGVARGKSLYKMGVRSQAYGDKCHNIYGDKDTPVHSLGSRACR